MSKIGFTFVSTNFYRTHFKNAFGPPLEPFQIVGPSYDSDRGWFPNNLLGPVLSTKELSRHVHSGINE